eukprot:7991043-Pyramimonas_sp.AAC.2
MSFLRASWLRGALVRTLSSCSLRRLRTAIGCGAGSPFLPPFLPPPSVGAAAAPDEALPLRMRPIMEEKLLS